MQRNADILTVSDLAPGESTNMAGWEGPVLNSGFYRRRRCCDGTRPRENDRSARIQPGPRYQIATLVSGNHLFER